MNNIYDERRRRHRALDAMTRGTSLGNRSVGADAASGAVEAQSAVAMQALIPASEIPGIADPEDGLPTSAEPRAAASGETP